MRRLGLLLLLALGACPSRGPEAALEDYARALEAGRLDDAWALTSPGWQAEADRADFDARFAEPAARRAEAARLRGLEAQLQVEARVDDGAPLLVHTPGGWRVVPPSAADLVPTPPPPSDEAQARAAVEAFVGAAGKGDFAAVYTLLSADLRARYGPDTLERDFVGAAPEARAAVARVRAALAAGTPVVIQGNRAYLPVGGGLAVRLVREDGAWRIAALR